MDQFLLPLFIVNCLMILVDASLGYHFTPQLLSGIENNEAMESGIKTTRQLLSVVVTIYMFFNCFGYFQRRPSYLFAVSGLIVMDLAIQYFMHRKRRGTDDDSDDYED